jgi:hypothetical protein
LGDDVKLKKEVGALAVKSEWLSSGKQATANAGEDVGEKEPSSTVGMEISAATVEISMEAP